MHLKHRQPLKWTNYTEQVLKINSLIKKTKPVLTLTHTQESSNLPLMSVWVEIIVNKWH
jgi:hypothetical protein